MSRVDGGEQHSLLDATFLRIHEPKEHALESENHGIDNAPLDKIYLGGFYRVGLDDHVLSTSEDTDKKKRQQFQCAQKVIESSMLEICVKP